MDGNENNLLTDKCLDLMGYCLHHQCSGFTLDIETPKGTAHCTFKFRVEIDGKVNE